MASPNLLRSFPVESLLDAARILRIADSICVTGIGASEGPARLCASSLAEHGRVASFLPLSAFMVGDHGTMARNGLSSCLVVFSQSLSPNVHMALQTANEFTTTLLVCGSDARVEDLAKPLDGKQRLIVRHAPAQETGFLMRVAGPAVASALALALAQFTTTEADVETMRNRLHRCADAMQWRLTAPLADVDLWEKPPALLVYGKDGVECSHLLRWTLLEYLDKHDPSAWDLLSFAHGAFQNIFHASRTLILPRSTIDVNLEPVVERLREMLGETQHTLVDVPSALPRPWCVLEHIAYVQALVLGDLRKHPRDLQNWPGRGRDGALYTLNELPSGAGRC